MVDNIKMFTEDFEGNLNFDNLQNLSPNDKESGYKYYKLLSRKDKDEKIFLVIKTKVNNEGKRFVSINGSLRKWVFAMNGFQDLTKKAFENAIDSIGKLLCGDSNALWGFRISKIEIGCNVQFPMEYKGIVDSYANYKTFRRVWYEGETMRFDGKEGYSMIVYDKGEEIVNARSVRKSKKNPEPIKKLIKRATWYRYEMKVKKMSKVAVLRDLANEPGKVLENWNKILDLFHGKVKKIKFFVETTPNYLLKIEGKNKTELKNYLIVLGMFYIGVPKTMALADKLKRKKEEVKEELDEMWYNFMLKDCDPEFENKIEKRISNRVRALKARD